MDHLNILISRSRVGMKEVFTIKAIVDCIQYQEFKHPQTIQFQFGFINQTERFWIMSHTKGTKSMTSD
jgi:hypothetical protein